MAQVQPSHMCRTLHASAAFASSQCCSGYDKPRRSHLHGSGLLLRAQPACQRCSSKQQQPRRASHNHAHVRDLRVCSAVCALPQVGYVGRLRWLRRPILWCTRMTPTPLQDFEVHTLASHFFNGSGTMLAHVPHTALRTKTGLRSCETTFVTCVVYMISYSTLQTVTPQHGLQNYMLSLLLFMPSIIYLFRGWW